MRTKTNAGDGEGTFDFIGVGGALQSTHYDLAIQDDLVGREASKSETIMKIQLSIINFLLEL